MIKDYLEVNTKSIVLLGDFNPKIIQPFWLSSKNIIRENEASNAKIDVIHNELVRYQIEDWASFNITPQKFEIRSSKEPYFEPLKDLVISIFSVLKETPIEAVGINHIYHYSLRSYEKYTKFGEKLASLNLLNDILNEPKLLGIEFIEKNRKDKLKGHYRFKIEPSDEIDPSQYGISININDHISKQESKSTGSFEIIKIFQENWLNSNKRAELITENLWKKLM